MLHSQGLSKNPWKNFQDIEGEIIREGTDTTKLADVIAKYREEISDVLNHNEAEWDIDEQKLKELKDRLEDKQNNILKPDLWKSTPCHINFSDNTDIENFWKRIIAAKWNHAAIDASGLASTPDKDWLKDKIKKSLGYLQFIHDDWAWKRQNWKLFGWKSTNMANISSTLSDTKIDGLLNATTAAGVSSKLKIFVNSVTSTKWNAFYIQHSKLSDIDEKETSIRIAWYLYMAYKIIEKNCLTQDLYDEINKVLDEQIIPHEIPKVKWLHNTKVELWYLEPEYETLKDLNVKKWDVDLWEKNLWAWGTITETRDLKVDFENWIAVDLDKYSLKASEIEIKDSTGNPIHVILNDWMLDFSDLSANKGIRLSSDILLDIWWSRLKVWKIFIDNDTLHQLDIKFDDEATIKAAATASWIALPSFPLDFSFNLKWTKKVSNGLGSCYASLKKKYIAKLKLWGVVPPPPPGLDVQREWATTISNVDQVNRAIAEREADEELRERYRNIGWNVLDRANLFLRRKFIKDKIVRKKMKWKEWFDWSDSNQSAAHRHQIEEQEKLSDNLKVIVDIDEVNYPQTRAELDTLIDDFTWKNSVPPRQWGISENNFKIRFEDILNRSGKDFDTAAPKKINEIIKSGNLRSLSSNIMMQAKQFQAHQKMVYNIREHIAANPWEADNVFDIWCRGEIENYINTFDDIPDFLAQMKLSLDNVDDIKTLKASTGALATIQAQSLKYRLQILDGGDEAYNVKKKWWLLTKAWRIFDDPTESFKFFDKHPHLKQTFWRIRWGAKLAVIPTTLLFAGAWPLATAWIIGGYSGLTTLIKKKSHYEKENRSYQRMQATNLTDYRNKRTNLANEVAWMKWYEWRFWWKKKRTRDQFRDYVLATQDQLELTSDLIAKIKAPLKKWWPLTAGEKDSLGSLLADWLARLDFHKKTWQNFLWSDNPGVAEKEYRQLQNAIIWWTLRLWIDMNDLRTVAPYTAYYDGVKKTIMKWTGNEYNTQWYEKARRRFKLRSNLKAIDSALMTWGISFGLSYLASSLTAQNQTRTVDTYTNQHSGKVWWEFNPWDVDESLLISWSSPTWSINPEMSAYINSSTHEIAWAQIYSSVDAIPCKEAFWLAQEAAAMSHLSSTYSTYGISPTSALAKAVNNYISDATSNIMAIPWLDPWNQHLAIARAVEAVNTWIVQPAWVAWIWNSININPAALSRYNWWIQASWVWTVSQWFRNMGIIWLDYVQHGTEEVIVNHATRAIAIPAWLNTFWSSESDPK